MRKRINQTLAILLAVVMVLCAVPVAYGATISHSGTCGENLTWTLDTEGLLTISGTGEMYDYLSEDNPAPYYGYRDTIRSLSIGEGVTRIGSNAFYNCSSLKSVSIPSSLTSSGGTAFMYCTGLTRVDFTDVAAWCNIRFESIASNPNDYASEIYLNGTLVTYLTIPNGVTKIGSCAFENFKDLQGITIPDSVTSIGACAFERCSSLINVTIPDSVTSIGGDLFFKSGVQSVKISSGVTSIPNYTFYDCANLRSVTIPDGVTSIGKSAFQGCSRLGSVEIPDSVTSIGASAFCKSGLSSVVIPNGVTRISTWTFSDCANLTSVTIPGSMTEIYNAFVGCTNLRYIYYYGTKTQWNNIDISPEAQSVMNKATIYYRGATVTDADSGISVTYQDGCYSGAVTISVTQVDDVPNYLVGDYERVSAWNIKTLVNGVETQPDAAVTVSIPVPAGYNENSLAVYHVNADGSVERVTSISVYNGKIKFTATSFSIYIVVDESSLHQHSYTSQVTKQPTCSEPGETTYTCACGDSYTTPIPTLDHTPGAAVRENETTADCNNGGHYDSVVYCTECGNELSRETVTTNALGHTEPDEHGDCQRCGFHLKDVCPWCGQEHVGFFAGLIAWFHGIFAKIFGARY